MSIIIRENQLLELCAQIDASGRFAMDLEFIPERSYEPKLCLVQVATDSGPSIIDPIYLPKLEPLWQRVTDPSILVVLHAAEQDLDLVYSFCQRLPQNIIDTQIAAGFAGFGYPIGYGKLLSQLLGVHLAKTESYTDWTVRPLSEAQIDYALDDVRHLLPIHDQLMYKLSESNRLLWVQEECKRYSRVEQYESDRSQDFLKIKGASGLSRRGLAVLQELCKWRHDRAYQLDRPPRSILSDNVLLELARRPPKTTKDILRIRGTKPELMRNHGSSIIDAVEKGLSVPDSECPLWPAFKSPPRRDVLVTDVLFVALKILCHRFDLATELVATRSELEHLVRSHREKRLPCRDIPLLSGWRKDIAGSALLELLEGASLELSIKSGEPPVSINIQDKSGYSSS